VRVADLPESGAIEGRWNRSVERFRRGTFLWLEGAGVVTLTLPALEGRSGTANSQPVPAGRQAVLAFAGRQDLRERRCLSARVSINGQDLPRFVPFVGWREYRLLVPGGMLRAGRNEVRFEITDVAGAPWRFAIAYVRLDLD
jgi:hypothetical protein